MKPSENTEALPTELPTELPSTELSPIIRADSVMRDIHLPDPISWWPLAPGWWILFAWLLLVLFIYLFLKHREKGKPSPNPLVSVHKEAVDELKKVYQIQDDIEFVQALSSLLKRVAITKYGKSVSGLAGKQWLEFLDSKWHSDKFTKGQGSVLSDLAYRPNPEIKRKEIVALVKGWIDHQLQPKGGG